MLQLLLVGCGGFFGASLRYLCATRIQETFAGSGFPWGTLGVNLIGCLVIGFVNGLLTHRYLPSAAAPLVVTGILGGFTTFSSFGLDSVTLMNHGRPIAALGYIMVSVFFGVLAVWIGRLPFAG